MERDFIPDPSPFKDHYLTLQVHPEADAAMIDAAYWHLMRRYSEQRVFDSSAIEKMDQLNEAYTVLRSAERREAYDAMRDIVLGSKALPLPPEPPPGRPPLPVMGKQRARPREARSAAAEPIRRASRGWRIPIWQNLLTSAVMFGLAVAALLLAHPAVVVGLMACGAAVTVIPLLGRVSLRRGRRDLRAPIDIADLAAAHLTGGTAGDLGESEPPQRRAE